MLDHEEGLESALMAQTCEAEEVGIETQALRPLELTFLSRLFRQPSSWLVSISDSLSSTSSCVKVCVSAQSSTHSGDGK